MALLALDPVLRRESYRRATAHDGVLVEQAFAALRRLVGATGGNLLSYHRSSGELAAIAGDALSNARVACSDLRAAVKAETTFLLAETRPRWITGADRCGEDLLIKLVDGRSRTIFLALQFAEQSAADRAHVMQMVPDLAVLVRCQLDLDARLRDLEEQKAATTEALDHGECGTIAVRADRSIVFANEAASRHLAQEAGLRIRRGVIRPVDHHNVVRFDAALDSVVESLGSDRPAPSPAYVMLLAGDAGARPTIIVIAPAGSARRQAEHGKGAVAIISILEPSTSALRGIDALCSLHGLSRVESRLMAHLTSGMTMSEAAAQMRIKSETARTYLKQIFAKTGIHRQTDLVALMTRYLRAVRGGFEFQPA